MKISLKSKRSNHWNKKSHLFCCNNLEKHGGSTKLTDLGLAAPLTHIETLNIFGLKLLNFLEMVLKAHPKNLNLCLSLDECKHSPEMQ